jgi:photosystem II stability/assembly factor-like uncharacterized protein
MSIGPYGADVRSLLAVPGTPSRLYAGTNSGEVFLSSDGAASWTPLHFPGPPVWTLSVDPTSSSVIWAGTTGGAYRSTDGGRSWERRGLRGNTIYQLAHHPSDPRTLYAATFTGVYKTINAGATWTPASADLTRQTFTLVLDPTAPDTLYAGTNGAGLLKSTNGGSTWTAADNGLPNRRIEWLVLDRTAPGTLYALTGSGVHKTTDGAGSWSAPTGPGSGLILAQAPSDPATLYLGTSSGDVHRTSNGAGNWTRLVQGLPRSQSPARFIAVWGLAVDPADASVVYAGIGDNAGIFRSTNGGTMWSEANAGLSGLATRALAVAPDDPARILVSAFIGQHGETFLSVNEGLTWSAVPSLRDRDAQHFLFDPVDPTIVYAATGFDLRRSLDGGQTFSTAGIGLSGGLNQLAGDASGVLYAAATDGIFRSADQGDTWDNVTGAIGGDFPWARAVVAGPTGGRVYVAMETTGVHRSDDAGDHWTAAAALPSLVVSLVVDPANDDVVYAGVLNNRVFKSQNGGASWSPAPTGLPSPGTGDLLAISPARASRIYLGTFTQGLFVSDDAAATWDPAGVGLYKTSVQAIAPHPTVADTVYAAIVGRSVFRSARGAR